MQSTAIYTKYRPTNFASLLGQERIRNILMAQITQSSVSHAYLFAGPRGCGKTTTARIFAKAINCLNWANDVCNECDNCIAINNESSMDVMEIDAASNRGIDEIRKLKEGINFLPINLKRKVYIIDEVHMLTKEAFNSLLKVLEEPPAHAIFILATTESHKIPETILSRVQRYDFGLAEKDIILAKLQEIAKNENVTLPTQVLTHIYTLSGGSFRDAESLLGKVLVAVQSGADASELSSILGIASDESLQAVITYIKKGEQSGLISEVDKLKAKGIDAVLVVKQLLALLQNTIKENISSADYRENEYKTDIKICAYIADKYSDIKYAFDGNLILKVCLLDLVEQLQNNSSKLVQLAQAEAPKIVNSEILTAKITKSASEIEMEPSSAIKLDFTLVIDEVAKLNPRFSLMLKSCLVDDFTDRTMFLRTPFKFDSEMINKPNFKQLLETAAKNVYSGFKLKAFRCVYDTTAIKTAVELRPPMDVDDGKFAPPSATNAIVAEEDNNEDSAETTAEVNKITNKKIVEDLFI